MASYEAYVEKNWKETGLAHLLVVRFLANGSADYGFFLVDLLCLGVKNAFGGKDVMASDVRELIADRIPVEFREPIHPACAKKMIEGAIAFAQKLGFAPHRDFRKARKVLSGIDASLCPTEFTYGENGKPCYVRGPEDDETRVNLILHMLEARCGPDGFIYDDPMFDDEIEEEVDLVDLRQELLEWLEAEPPEVPRFYELSGIATGLLICPVPVSPLKLFDVLWGPGGHEWEDDTEAQEFSRLLADYWNHLRDLVTDCIAPDGPAEAHPVDVWWEDFEDEPALHVAIASLAWAQGFMRATQIQPEAWGNALTRADLAPHWDVVSWWAHFDQSESRDALSAAIDADPARTLTSAVAALARALRRATP